MEEEQEDGVRKKKRWENLHDELKQKRASVRFLQRFQNSANTELQLQLPIQSPN